MPSQADITIIVRTDNPAPPANGTRQLFFEPIIATVKPGDSALFTGKWRNADGSVSEMTAGESLVFASFAPEPPGVHRRTNAPANPINQIIVDVDPGTPDLQFTFRIEGRP